MNWIFLSLLAPFLIAATNIVDKIVLSKWSVPPFMPLFALGIFNIIAAVAMVFWGGVHFPQGLEILWIAIMSLTYMTAALLYFYACSFDEISRLIPYYNGVPLFVLAFGMLFLGTFVTGIQTAGIFLLVIGGFLLSWDFREKKLAHSKALAFMILSSILFSLYNIVSSKALETLNYETVFCWSRLGIGTTLPLLYMIYRKEVHAFLPRLTFPIFGTSLLSEAFNTASALVVIMALSVGNVSLVSAVGAVQPLFVLLAATLFSIFVPAILKEDLRQSTLLQKLISTLLMVAGMILVIQP